MPSMECEQEFEVLESIYKEIEIVPETPDGGSLVSILLYPKSAGDMESRYVTVKLELHLPPTYPMTLPRIEIRNPRGLSQEQLEDLENTLDTMKNESIGLPVLFQLIDFVQDYLTSNNRPSAECPICLMSFTDFDVFYTPACFHHYHSHCLGLHLHNLVNTKKENADNQVPSSPVEILCPVCRVELDPDIDIEKLLASPPATENEITDPEIPPIGIPQQDRNKLEALFQKQKEQGGIIDLNEDCIRLLRISDHVAPTAEGPQAQAQAVDGTVGNRQRAAMSTERTERSQLNAHGVEGGSNPTRVRTSHGHYKAFQGSRGSRGSHRDFGHRYNQHRRRHDLNPAHPGGNHPPAHGVNERNGSHQPKPSSVRGQPSPPTSHLGKGIEGEGRPIAPPPPHRRQQPQK